MFKILLADKISDKDTTKSRLRWTIEEKFILLEAVLEHLPDSLPWSEIADKFEERSPQRNTSSCHTQWIRKKEKGLIAWLLENID
ncbi:hypothetical protein RclHR1_01060003 [Rhizophagus clarus]|nr:hypothetical protein RclHR1_01060003 [Rhizophagus clarus]